MTIVFTPLRRRSVRASGPDLTVRVRRSRSAAVLEVTFSADAQDRVRYIDGDRVIPRFDEDTKSWAFERIDGRRSQDGYKVLVRELKTSGRSICIVRLTCKDASQATAVLGARDFAEYEFLEVVGNTATFVEVA